VTALVVFVHGLIGPLADPAVLDAMAPADTLAADLRGYGARASHPVEGLTIDDQVDALEGEITASTRTSPTAIHLVGHSVGGVIAARFADRHPDLIASFTSLEGNFTLNDAFWSGRLAAMHLDEATQLLDRDRRDPEGWLRAAGVECTPTRIAGATEALNFQPPATIHAMAQAVVAFTGASTYEPMLRRVFAAHPVHLVAGTRSRAGWDVPEWAIDAAATYQAIPDCGHMVMLEQPHRLAALLATLVQQVRAQVT
jgi:pimeloyl-ACP methyl ester carboxylesterase